MLTKEEKFKDNPHLEGERDEFIEKNMRLAYSIANRFSERVNYYDLSMDDIRSIAMIGLIKAYDNYDPTGYDIKPKFSTYAVPKIAGEILRTLRETHNGGLKVSRPAQDIIAQMRREEAESFYKTETAELIASDYNSTIGAAKEVLGYLNGETFMKSTEEKVSSSEDSDFTLGETIAINSDFSNLFIEEFLETLSDSERKVVEYHIIKGKTQSETSKIVGKSQVQISRTLKAVREKAEKYKKGNYKNSNFNAVKREEKRKKVKEEKEMVSSQLQQVIQLLQTTDLSYREITDRTGASYSTVCYYGKEVRTPEERAKNRKKQLRQGNKKPATSVREVKVSKKKHVDADTNIINVEPPKVVQPNSKEKTAKSGFKFEKTGSGLNVADLQEEFAEVLEMLNSSNSNKNLEFRLEVQA